MRNCIQAKDKCRASSSVERCPEEAGVPSSTLGPGTISRFNPYKPSQDDGLLVRQNLYCPAHRDKPVCPQKRKPERHHAEQAVTVEAFHVRTYKNPLKEHHRKKPKKESWPIIMRPLHKERDNDDHAIDRGEYAVIGNERNKPDHKNDRDRIQKYADCFFHVNDGFVY